MDNMEKVVVSVGGSLIVPEDGIDSQFLQQLITL